MKVTIAIPFFNDEKYIRYAIQSAINQSYQDFELILINDGSTDDSIKIAREFASRDQRIILIDDGRNYGLAVRLNQSIKMAKGEYYARMDADDIMCTERIKIQVDYLDKHRNVDVVGSSCMIIDMDNKIIGSHNMSNITRGFIHPTVMGRLEWFRKNPYAERFIRCQDRDLWLRTADKSCFENILPPLLFYRDDGTEVLKKYRQSQKTNIEIAEQFREYGKNIWWYISSIFLSYAKIILCYLLSVFGGTKYLVKMKRRSSLPNHLLLAERALQDAIDFSK